MENILYLVHRLPYPPNKGDKVRSFNILKYLSTRYNVYLGAFIDDESDYCYVDRVSSMCAGLHISKLNPLHSKIKSVKGFFSQSALTLNYYNSDDLARWVLNEIISKNIKTIVVFSSVMAKFIQRFSDFNVVVDFVDVDSEKWRSYSLKCKWPMSWVYRREAEYLLKYERWVAASARISFFVTENEASLFSNLAPEVAPKISYFNNGVDTEFFQNSIDLKSPFSNSSDSLAPLVFTGAMDYWPNIDAVIWFARDIFPQLKLKFPSLCFYIVGRNPSAAVLDLVSDSIFVTGTVVDVRPYLQYSSAVVAPLRIARGIQNKILEAMAMSRPVIGSSLCVSVIDAELDVDLLAAEAASDFVDKIEILLIQRDFSENIGKRARQCVLRNYSWDAHLKKLGKSLECFSDGICV